MAEQPQAPEEVREGVREALLTSLTQDFDMIGGRTARRLAMAGLAGIGGAVGATLLVAGHSFEQHPPGLVVVFSTVWAGLLVVSLALGLLRIRTPSLALGQAAMVGVLGLAMASLCSFLCSHEYFLDWWGETVAGAWVVGSGGVRVSALCFGVLTSLFFGAASVLVVFPKGRADHPNPLLPAAMIFLLLAPGVALQTVGSSLGVFVAWTLGTGIGAYLGVAGGLFARSLLPRT
jgi:hypothetical protein